MPFGSFIVEQREPRAEKAPVLKESSHKAPKHPDVKPPDSQQLRIVLMGRNLSIIQEFLCSMSQNMSEALNDEGLSFYSRELDSISGLIAQKKRLEQFFWAFRQDDWVYPADEETQRSYTFSISLSGNQTRVLDLLFHCVTPAAGALPGQADALWVLADGLLLSDTALTDPYTQTIREALSSPGQMPVCLILSQIEGLGRFGGSGSLSTLPDKVWRTLRTLCRERFPAPCDGAIIPVQVYGGMECTGADEKGDPVLHIGTSGFYQSYIPDNCQVPGLYTIQAIAAARQIDFFPDAPEGGLLSGIRRHYGAKFGTPEWAPAPLRSKEDV